MKQRKRNEGVKRGKRLGLRVFFIKPELLFCFTFFPAPIVLSPRGGNCCGWMSVCVCLYFRCFSPRFA